MISGSRASDVVCQAVRRHYSRARLLFQCWRTGKKREHAGKKDCAAGEKELDNGKKERGREKEEEERVGGGVG